jgi:spore coat protein U-like protein
MIYTQWRFTMQFNKTLLAATLLTAGGFAAIASANAAGTETSTFGVTMEVNSVCSVDASGGAIDFGKNDAGTTAATVGVVTSTGTIDVTCSLNAPYIVNLKSANDLTSSTTGAGQMNHASGTDKVTYQLYSEATAAAGEEWGSDGTLIDAGTGVTGTGAGLTVEATTHQVFAKLTSTTDVQLGDYSDTITASVIY